MITLGVLALQGSFAEHLYQIEQMEGVCGVPVRTAAELNTVQAIILPGGESTAMRKLMERNGFLGVLKERIRKGMPVWGTCAGMILLAGEVVGEEPHLGVMHTRVSRNAYGTQQDSFQATGEWILGNPAQAEMTFIRAPRFEGFSEPAVPAAMLKGQVTGVVQGNMLATAFHPELSGDKTAYRWLIERVENTCIQE